MIKILIVEDEPEMLMGLQDNLEFDGYEVDTANEGLIGQKKIMTSNYDLVLLDVMLPDASGFEICKAVRKKGIDTPIIMLTARGDELDKVRGLELGADDYITKPFSLRELSARIKTILRRTTKVSEAKQKDVYIKIGKLSVSFDKFDAYDETGSVKLSHKEFDILQYLYENRGGVVTRDKLLDNVWGFDYQPTQRTVDNFILRLRQKIDENEEQHIVTVHGIGYKLVL